VPVGGYLYAYFGLPRLTIPDVPPGYDPVSWLADPKRIPVNRTNARTLLRAIYDRFH
jgi:hypothetical protein